MKLQLTANPHLRRRMSHDVGGRMPTLLITVFRTAVAV
jgi:hypothetical protein